MSDEPRQRVSAYAIALADDHLLLTLLSGSSAVFEPGLWHLPGGGVDPGEQPADTLVRELREETGLRVLGADLVDARSYLVRRPGVTWQAVGLFYRARLAPGRPAVTKPDDSTAAARWVPCSELADTPLSPPTRDALSMIG